jgi:transposase InsO family protein
MHDGTAGGHRAYIGTYNKIKAIYYWPGMAGMIKHYVETCVPCQMRGAAKYKEPLHPTRSLGPGYLVHLDISYMPKATNGMRYVLDARDNLTGFVEAKAIRGKTEEAITAWVEDFYLRHPFIQRFVADNGSEFKNALLMSTLEKLGVPITFIPKYHPESNSPVERGHSPLKNTLGKWCAAGLRTWHKMLKQAVYAENVTIKRTTGYTPHLLWYGTEANYPIESIVKTWGKFGSNPSTEDILARLDLTKETITEEEIVKVLNESELTTDELVAIRARQINEQDVVLDEAVERVMKSRMQDKVRWDAQRYVRTCPLQVGDLVLEHKTCLETTWSCIGKLGSRWRGPFRIKEAVGNGTYRIAELDGTVAAQVVSGSRLKKFLIRDPAFTALMFCYGVTI